MNSQMYSKKTIYIKLLAYIISILINLLFVLITVSISGSNFDIWVTPFATISLLQLIFNVFILKRLGEDLFSLSTLFLLFSYMFHLGQVFVIGFSIESKIPIMVTDRVPTEVFMEASKYFLFVQTTISLGIQAVFLLLNKKINNESLNINKDKELQLVRKIGFILFLIGVIPTLYIDLGKIILFLNGGYLATYTLLIPGFLVIISKMFGIGILMMLIGNKNNFKLSNQIFIFALLYYLFIMLSGNRGWPTVFIITLFYVYVNVIRKIKVKGILKFSFLGYLILVILNTISDFRHYIQPNFSKFLEIFQKNIGSPIGNAIGEFGATMVTPSLALMYFPDYAPIQYGKNYLAAFLLIFPNVGSAMNEILLKVTYTDHLPNDVRLSLGGSYIGELFYSFNYGGIFFALFFGIFIGVISKQIKKFIITNQFLKLSCLIILFPGIIWWIRGYFSGLIREFIWISLLILILNMILNEKHKKKSYGFNLKEGDKYD